MPVSRQEKPAAIKPSAVGGKTVSQIKQSHSLRLSQLTPIMATTSNRKVMIFDDHQIICDLLKTVFDSRGYEVQTFQHPGECPLFDKETCSCPIGQSCTDVILTDINMPVKKGLDFIEEQLAKGCHCKHLALMSGDYTYDEMERVKKLGLKFFQKPFAIKDVIEWLDQIENNMAPQE